MLKGIVRALVVGICILTVCPEASAVKKDGRNVPDEPQQPDEPQEILVIGPPLPQPSPQPVRPSTRPADGAAPSEPVVASPERAQARRQKICRDLNHGLAESTDSISVFNGYLQGTVSLDDLLAKRQSLGNAWSGITEEGKKRSPAERSVIDRVEADVGLKLRGMALLNAAMWREIAGEKDAFWKAWAANEIDRQKAANALYQQDKKLMRCK